ncbi:hypothetical protein OAH97_02065, partial [Octadecabacter sp.]|nr:hypothetical protein [Octadecabacter sp.]
MATLEALRLSQPMSIDPSQSALSSFRGGLTRVALGIPSAFIEPEELEVFSAIIEALQPDTQITVICKFCDGKPAKNLADCLSQKGDITFLSDQGNSLSPWMRDACLVAGTDQGTVLLKPDLPSFPKGRKDDAKICDLLAFDHEAVEVVASGLLFQGGNCLSTDRD